MHVLTSLYVILCSVQVPFNLAYIALLWRYVGSEDTVQHFGAVYLLIAAVYYICLFSLGAALAVGSFRTCREEDAARTLRIWTRLKFGMIPFFFVNFVSIALLFLVMTVASRGIFLIGILAAAPAAMFCTWAALLPSAFWGIRAVRISIRCGVLSEKRRIWHMLAQFVFLIDVLDCAYLCAVRWKRYRGVSAAVCILYLLGLLIGALFVAAAYLGWL